MRLSRFLKSCQEEGRRNDVVVLFYERLVSALEPFYGRDGGQ
jgi:hypothetical protein